MEKVNPLSSVEAFTSWLDINFGCVNCINLGDKDKPIHERLCTHKYANKSCNDYDNGMESDKSWLRQDDINRELKCGGSLPLPIRDVNEYFVCTYFKSNK